MAAKDILSVDAAAISSLAGRLRGLGQEAPQAMASALNRARTSVTQRMVRWIARESGVPSTRIRKSMRSRPATRQRLDSFVSLYPGRAPLIHWRAAKQRQYLPKSGFKARMPGSGHLGYFERAPHARARRLRPGVWHTLPIREVYGPPWTEVLTAVGLADVLQYGGQRLREELEAELARREERRGAA